MTPVFWLGFGAGVLTSVLLFLIYAFLPEGNIQGYQSRRGQQDPESSE